MEKGLKRVRRQNVLPFALTLADVPPFAEKALTQLYKEIENKKNDGNK